MSDHDFAVQALVDRALVSDPEHVASVIEEASLEEAAAFVMECAPRDWTRVFRSLSSERAAGIMDTLGANGAKVLAALDIPLAASVVARVSPTARESLLAVADESTSSELKALLEYPPATAGRAMDPRAMSFRSSAVAGSVLERIRSSPWKRIFEVFVVDENGVLVGSAPLQEIAVAPATTAISELAKPVATYVTGMATREEVVEILETQKLPVLPVVDLDGRLLGVIRHEELIAATQAEASVDMQTMVGASKEERALSKVSFAVKKRLPWLQVNLVTAFLAASVVGLFEATIAQFTALAVLLPVVAGQSGNTGAQALAVTMRGLALREVRVRQWLPVVFKEFRVGLVNGVAVAITTSFAVFLWSRSVGLGIVIGVSMVISMGLAGLSGGAIPMLLTAIGQDPAQSSSIILTTVTDVVGFFSFLGIATILSGML